MSHVATCVAKPYPVACTSAREPAIRMTVSPTALKAASNPALSRGSTAAMSVVIPAIWASHVQIHPARRPSLSSASVVGGVRRCSAWPVALEPCTRLFRSKKKIAIIINHVQCSSVTVYLSLLYRLANHLFLTPISLSLFPRLFSKDLGARIRELQSGHSVSISAVTVSSEGRARYLECDEVCAQEERNRKLAIALEIDNPNISPIDTEVQYSTFLLEQARLVLDTW